MMSAKGTNTWSYLSINQEFPNYFSGFWIGTLVPHPLTEGEQFLVLQLREEKRETFSPKLQRTYSHKKNLNGFKYMLQ